MVAELRRREDWRRPGCDARCRAERVIKPGLLGRVMIVAHDPDAHEEFGLAAAGLGAHRRVVTGPLVVDLGRNIALLEGRELGFTGREWAILVHLARNLGRACPPAEILTAVFGPEWAESSHVLRVNVTRMRQRLMQAGGLIQTRFGVGYRLLDLPAGMSVAEVAAITGARRWGWSRNWEQCRRCGRRDVPHQARGLCIGCWTYYRRAEYRTDGERKVDAS